MRPFVRVNRLALAVLAILAVIPAGAAQAQTPAGTFGDYKMDAKKPVDIQADRLEVDDKKQIATFNGNVIAKQGDYTIRAAELVVTYTSTQPKKKAPPLPGEVEKPAKTAGEPNADIKYIEAKGNVIVSSTRDNQSAKANNGHFDVKAQTITLFDDVVVSKDKNVIKGERLLIELALGKSTFLSNDATAAVNDPNAPKQQRLRMIITPQSATSGAVNQKKPENTGASPWAPAAPQ
jgi:lipopolysaccharide export system protein LptA